MEQVSYGNGSFSNSSLAQDSSRLARYQTLIALVLGLSAFLTFSVLRARYPKIYVANLNHLNLNYVHSSARRNLPKLPYRTLFGWIPILYKVEEEKVLEYAGLDALVFLQFFKMCIKAISVCLILALTIISPIRYKYTGWVDYPNDGDDEENENYYNRLHNWSVMEEDGSSFQQFLWMYTVFTYVFTLVFVYFLFQQTITFIQIRQKYLGSQKSVTDRTIKLSGIPPFLRVEEDLKRHIESLGIGEVDAVVVVKEWNDLNYLFHMRRQILRDLEVYWLEFFESNGIKNKVDLLSINFHPNVGESFLMNNTPQFRDEEEEEEENSLPDSNDENENILNRTESGRSSILAEISEIVENETIDTNHQLPLLNDTSNRRPIIRKGFLGLFGAEIDAIDHYTEKLEVIDKEIIKARTRYYPPSSTAFVTMKSVAQAQVIAQAVLDPKVNHLITRLAPAPHDIIWENLCLTRRERNLRIFLVSLTFGLISIILVVPVRYLTNFLNTKTISRVWPQLGLFLENNRWAEALVTGILPPYIFTIFNIVMPYFYIWVASKQGYTSHSDEELSTVSMNFFYIFVNLFLVFTLFGTASLSDTTKIASQLAKSLKDLSLFYVDLIILQGLGIFPYKLLLLGNLLNFSIGSLFWCKTPRDYLNLYRPPVFNFGLSLPQPILILVITIVYSAMSTKILTAGLLYFMIGYFVYKYQLLYACVHPPHSTGKVWPLIFRRVILALLLFQLTMVGILILQKGYICASFLAPLPIISLACLWNFQRHYIPLSIFIALRSIENNQLPLHDDESFVDSITPPAESRTLDELRESEKTYEYPYLIDNLDGPLIAIDRDEVLLINQNSIITKKAQAIDEWT